MKGLQIWLPQHAELNEYNWNKEYRFLLRLLLDLTWHWTASYPGSFSWRKKPGNVGILSSLLPLRHHSCDFHWERPILEQLLYDF